MRPARPLPPGSTIGILGGGQLGRMLALAGARLGLRSHIFAPEEDSPAFEVAAAQTVAAYDDLAALEAFAAAVDAVTYEFENVPSETAAYLSSRVPLAPSAPALRIAQDRLEEKTFLQKHELPVAPFAAADDEASLAAAIRQIGTPAILKTRRLGYDGKGQARIETASEASAAWSKIGEAPAVLEAFVDFTKEISVIAARGWDGAMAIYDVPENRHEHHILRSSTVPAAISQTLAQTAHDFVARIAAEIDYVGVIAVELFVTGDALIINEIAPRVHNSGHWTIDACHVSQFEQHMRAVAGWPLGDPRRHSDVVMQNLLGEDAKRWRSFAAQPSTSIHLYGKKEARPGRKMGHLTRLAPRQD